ncbi:MAG TPA: hypothetical protein VGP63_19805 [Planctomycetaceae bacterium]|jgi:hypothetical protein|nr:hypothetical protein [Planctomycetaceae bacterium]
MQPTRRAREVILALLALALVAIGAEARAQVISSVTPLALRPGQTQDLALQGNGLGDARQLWTGFPQKSVVSPAESKGQKNPAAVAFKVTVPPQAPLGIYGIRVASSTGVSPLRLMLLDDLPTVRATAANVTRAAAQPLSLPTAVEGTLAPQQLHYFKFHAEAGQRVSFEVYARRIGSLLDPTLRLFDTAGREVTYSDDVPGLSEDAAIQRTFRTAGEYVLELGDNVYQGGGEYFYRLRIGDFPAAALPYPMAATRGGEFTCEFGDSSKSLIAPVHGKAPSDPGQATLFVPARQSNGNAQSFAPILLSDHKQSSEAEPNNSPKTATRVDLGADLNGRLDVSDDVDHFVFHAPAEEVVEFTSFSRRLGSPADVVLRLLKSDGSQLGFAESQGAQEATLTATLPGTGDYVLEIRDLSHRGGPRFVYRVETVTQPAKPSKDQKKHSRRLRGFALSAAADSVVIPAGGTAAIPVTATRSNYGGPIAVRAVGLPAGVKSLPTWIGGGEDTVELTLQSTAELPAGVIHSIKIVGSPEHSEATIAAQTTEAVKTQLGNMPYPPLALCTDLALVAGPRPAFTLHSEPSDVALAPGHPVTLKLIVERQRGFDEEIALAVSPAKKGLPPGVTVGIKPIAKGANAAEITFTANDKAAPTLATVVLVGTLKKGNQAIAQLAPGIGLAIERPSSRRKPQGKKT